MQKTRSTATARAFNGTLMVTTALVLGLGAAGPAAAQTELVTALDSGPGGDEDARPWVSGAGHTTHVKQFITPTIFNQDLTEIIPYAAESWESNDDFTVWTYRLREDLAWSDGEPMTAHDWKFTAEFMTASDFVDVRLADRDLAFQEVVGFEAKVDGEAEELEGLRVIDDRTIEFTLSGPNPRHHATLFRTYILPEHAVDFAPSEYLTTDWFRNPDKMVGSGPFVVEDYQRDAYLTLGANEHYFEGTPELDRLVIRYFGGDQTSSLLALRSGDVEFTYVTETDAPALEDDFQIFSNLSGVVVMERFNYDRVAEHFQDIRVRQAILHAIDREAITEQILAGTHVVLPCPIPYDDLWPEDVNFYPYDPERATALLEEAGVDPGDISMEWVGHAGYNNTAHNSALQAVQGYLSQIGITDFSYRFVDIPAFRSHYKAGGDWDEVYVGYGVPRYGHDLGNLWENSGSLGQSVIHYDFNAEGFDEVIADIRSAPTQEAYEEGMAAFCRLHNETLPDLQLWVGRRYGAAAQGIEDFWWQPAPGGGPYDDDAHLWNK